MEAGDPSTYASRRTLLQEMRRTFLPCLLWCWLERKQTVRSKLAESCFAWGYSFWRKR